MTSADQTTSTDTTASGKSAPDSGATASEIVKVNGASGS